MAQAKELSDSLPCDLLDGNSDEVEHANLPPLVFHPSFSSGSDMFLDNFKPLPPVSFLEEDENDCFFPIETVTLPEILESAPIVRPKEVKSTISRKRSSSDLASQALESSMSLLSMVSSSSSPTSSPNSTSRRLGEVSLAKKRSSSDLLSLLETTLSHQSTHPSTSSPSSRPSSRPSSPSRPLRHSLRPSRTGSPVQDASSLVRAPGPPLSSHARSSSRSSSRDSPRSCSRASARCSSSRSRSSSPSSCASPYRASSRSPSVSPKGPIATSASSAAASAAAAAAAAAASFSSSSSTPLRPRSLSITGTSFSYSFPVSPTGSSYSVDSDDEGALETPSANPATASTIHRSISLPSLSVSASVASRVLLQVAKPSVGAVSLPKAAAAPSRDDASAAPSAIEPLPSCDPLDEPPIAVQPENRAVGSPSLIKSEGGSTGVTTLVSAVIKQEVSPVVKKEEIELGKSFDSFSPTSPVNFSDDVFLNEGSDWNLDALTLTSGGLSPLPHDDHGTTRNVFASDSILSSPSQLIMSHPPAKHNSLSPLPLDDPDPDLYHLSSLSLSAPFESANRNMYHPPPRSNVPTILQSSLTAAAAAAARASHSMSSDLSLSSLSEVLSSFSAPMSTTEYQSSLPDEVGPLPFASNDVEDCREWDPKSQNSSYYSSDSSMNGRYDTDDDYYPMRPSHMMPESPTNANNVNNHNNNIEAKDEGFRNKRKVSIEGPRASCHQCKTSLSLQELVQCTVGHEEHRRRNSSTSKKGDKSDGRRGGWLGVVPNPFVWNNKSFSAETKASVQANASPPMAPAPDPLGRLPDIKKLKFMLRDEHGNIANNPNMPAAPTRAKSGRCRKKYCLRCFSEYLAVCSFEQAPAGLLTKSCPACALVCHCAACGRKMGVVQPPPTRISCHQCKHQSSPAGSLCCTRVKDKANPRGCRKKFCSRCLLGYKIVADQVASESWLCPACIGICECSNCRSDRASPSMFSVPDLPSEKGKANPRRGRESNQQDFVVTNRKKAR